MFLERDFDSLIVCHSTYSSSEHAPFGWYPFQVLEAMNGEIFVHFWTVFYLIQDNNIMG